MSRRQSYSQQVFPTTAEFTACLKKLKGYGAKVMLGYVWAGFDGFKKEILDKNPPPTRDNADLERDLTEMLYPYIFRALPASLPFYLQHEKKEREQAVPGKQPPEPDLSFILFSNVRIAFPMDVKVVERDTLAGVADYADTVQNRFLTCVYAPFSKEGAMIAFLLSGSVKTLFQSLGAAIGCTISRNIYIPGRDHRTSWHDRSASACKYKKFRCHHLVIAVHSQQELQTQAILKCLRHIYKSVALKFGKNSRQARGTREKIREFQTQLAELQSRRPKE